MKVKIFTAYGHDLMMKVEGRINEWLENHPLVEVRDTQTALCQVAEDPEGEHYQCLVITIWYDGNANVSVEGAV